MEKKKKLTIVFVFLLMVICVAVTAIICLNLSKNNNEIKNTEDEQTNVTQNEEEIDIKEENNEVNDEKEDLRSKYPDVEWATDTDNSSKTGYKFKINDTKIIYTDNTGNESEIDVKVNLKSIKSYLNGGILSVYALAENGEVYYVQVIEKSVNLVEKLKNIIDIGENKKNNVDPICFLTNYGNLLNHNGNDFVTLENNGENLRSKYPDVKWATNTDTHRFGFAAQIDGTKLVYSDNSGNKTELDLNDELKSVKIYLSSGIISAYVLSTSGHVYNVQLVEKEYWDLINLNRHFIVDIGENSSDSNSICFLTNEGLLVNYEGNTY